MTGKTVGGPKILLVDDDKIVIEALTDLFKRILPAVGIVDSATSGVEAVSYTHLTLPTDSSGGGYRRFGYQRR